MIYKEYFMVAPMVEANDRISTETLAKICEALPGFSVNMAEDRGGIAFFKLNEAEMEADK